MTINTINDYNKYLIDNNIEIKIIDYIKEINNKFYNIDINFIDNFMNLIDKDDFCIPHNYLIEYNIISNSKGNIQNIKDILKQYNFKIEIDYKVMEVHYLRGTKKEYILHPDTFKLCLIRSKNSKKYAKYYILLEKCIKYYNEYQLYMKKNKINILCDKLDESNKKSDKLCNKIDEQNNKIDDLLEQNDEINNKLDIVVEDRVPRLKNINKSEYFILLKNKNKENEYYVIRGQKKITIIKLNKYLKNDYELKIKLEVVPNSRIFYNHIKEKIENIECNYNNITSYINEYELLEQIKEIYNLKYKIDYENPNE